MHAALDASLVDHPVSDLIGYRRFLLTHAAALPVLTKALEEAEFGWLCPGWTGAPRMAALMADLDGLGLAQPPASEAVPGGRAEAWGIAYVVEGARLGGRLLERQALDGGDPRIRANARFLADRTGLNWRDLSDRLDAALREEDDLNAAIQAARASFALYADAAAVS